MVEYTDNLLITQAELQDGKVICELLGELGYPGAEDFMEKRLKELSESELDRIYVARLKNRTVGFLCLHYIPQIGLERDFARITYFCVAEQFRGSGIGKSLLRKAEEESRNRPCDRMELHSHFRRKGAHIFYLDYGYEEVPKYLIKRF